MGVRILEGTYDGTQAGAVMVDSVSGTAFGPLFDSHDDAEAFLEWVAGYGPVRALEAGAALELRSVIERPDDPRGYSDGDLGRVVAYWREHVKAALTEGAAR